MYAIFSKKHFQKVMKHPPILGCPNSSSKVALASLFSVIVSLENSYNTSTSESFCSSPLERLPYATASLTLLLFTPWLIAYHLFLTGIYLREFQDILNTIGYFIKESMSLHPCLFLYNSLHKYIL